MPDRDRTGDAECWLGELEALFRHATVGLGIFDDQLRYRRVNGALREIIGLPDDKLLGRNPEEAIPGFGAVFLPRLQRVLATGRPVRDLHLWGRTPASGGERRCYAVSYFRLDGPDGPPLGVASVVVDVTARRRAEQEAARSAARLRLLSRAGRVLGSTLDIGQNLAALADLTVPTFADHCIVDLVTEPGALRRVALVHAEGVPPGGTAAWHGAGGPVEYPEAHPVSQVLRTGAGLLVADVPAGRIDAVAPDARSAAYGHATGLRSAVVVPLTMSGQVAGVLSFATSVSGRRYDEADLELALEIAARAAVALDNAAHYQRERTAALTLQRSLLPDRLPDVPGLVTDSRYLPGEDDEVGGDWFDVVPVGGGCTGLVIGDVMGRGLAAAAVMGQLRAAVRSSALLGLSPAALLHHLDQLVQGLDRAQLVTCTYGVFDPAAGTVTLSTAGHPPPLLLHGGSCAAVGLEPGTPLGVGAGGFAEQVVTVAPGDTLVLYTDGLVERRDGDLDAAIAALADALAGAAPDVALCDVAIGAVPGTGAADDAAVLVIRVTGEKPPKPGAYSGDRHREVQVSSHDGYDGPARRPAP